MHVRKAFKLLRVPIVALTLAVCGGHWVPHATAAAAPQPGNIDRARLLAADSRPGDWLTAGREFGKTHYSPLQQIDRGTVARLGFAWAYDTHSNRGLEATPIVVDGVMYTSGMEGRVYALDARTGREIWTFVPEIDRQINRQVCCDAVNRGVAVWQGQVYVAALDGQLYALDAQSGAVVWKADTIIDKARGYSSTGAPEVAGNAIVIGNAGADLDARGYITAYDLKSGKFLWRFFIVPGDPSKPFEHPELEWAAKTWDPNSRWDVGGGGTVWDAMVYDPQLNLLYVGTGNAALYTQAKRSPSGGDNLFLSSILAINPETGRLVWHYQEVPGDQWDYTATAPMILTDLKIHGVLRKVLLHAPKNGFFYVLDRKTGEFLSAKNIVPVNWTTGIDPKTGRPTINKAAVDYTREPKFVVPFTGGAHSWTPMAFNPNTGLVYVPLVEAGMVMFDSTPGPDYQYRPKLRNSSAYGAFVDGPESATATPMPAAVQALVRSAGTQSIAPRMRGFLRAWDPVAQKEVWSIETSGWWDRSGVLTTAGDLLFQGTAAGVLKVYDARDGKVLKEIDTGSGIVAAPMTYSIDGRQYVAVMAGLGGGPLGFSPPPGSANQKYGNAGRILAFMLDGGETPKPALLPPIPPIPQPPPLTAAAASRVSRGETLFAAYCSACHRSAAPRGRGASADLRRMNAGTHAAFNQIVLQGTLRPLGMPQWNDVLTNEEADALHAYLISEQWQAYRAEQSSATTPQQGPAAAH